MNRTLVIVSLGVIVLLAIGGGWYLIKDKPEEKSIVVDDSSREFRNQVVETIPEEVVEETGEVKTIEVEGADFKFMPTEIRVKKGDRVEITFRNTGGNHNFVIDEFDVKTNNIQEGDEEAVEFLADRVGTFEYYCGVGQHKTMGMKGKLIVE